MSLDQSSIKLFLFLITSYWIFGVRSIKTTTRYSSTTKYITHRETLKTIQSCNILDSMYKRTTFPRAASCVALHGPFFIFLPFLTFHSGTSGNVYLSRLLLPPVLTDLLDHCSPLFYYYFCKVWCLVTLVFCVLQLIILCVLPSSRSPRWRGGRVARAALGDPSACSVALLEPHTFHIII